MIKKKSEAEKVFVDYLISVGIESWSKMYERGHWYYCFWLKNGEMRCLCNISEKSLSKIKAQLAQEEKQ